MSRYDASNAPTLFADINSHTIAYRSIGIGMPLILCQRLRGVLDSWDPAFLDNLSEHFRVIVFDYRGIGNSSGAANFSIEALAKDVTDLADALGIDIFVAGGWSIGALVIQWMAKEYPDRISHIVLMGAMPFAKSTASSLQSLYKQALIFDDDPDHEMVLFFGSPSDETRFAAQEYDARVARRATDRSPKMIESAYKALLARAIRKSDLSAEIHKARFLQTSRIPILVISGAVDIISPTRNWLEYLDVWQCLHLFVIPRTGHAPHQREPKLCAALITSFVSSVD